MVIAAYSQVGQQPLPFTTVLAEAYATSVVINSNSNTTGIFMIYALFF